MENKKQSSVEWLYNTIDYEIVSYLDGEIDLNELSIAMLKIKEQAKAMHKEEIMESISSGYEDGIHYASGEHGRYESPEQYYNETFGGQDNDNHSSNS
jgi:hypothetical protein